MEKLLKIHDLIRVVPLSKPSIYRLIKKGVFPKPVKLSSRAVAWRESDIKKWTDNLSQAS